jgi:hypothetical protein
MSPTSSPLPLPGRPACQVKTFFPLSICSAKSASTLERSSISHVSGTHDIPIPATFQSCHFRTRQWEYAKRDGQVRPVEHTLSPWSSPSV